MTPSSRAKTPPLPPGSSARPAPARRAAVLGGAARGRSRADPAAAGEPGIVGLRMLAVQVPSAGRVGSPHHDSGVTFRGSDFRDA
ncbi:hypothetical protein ACRRTK_012865 [Alexandromys fortis]